MKTCSMIPWHFQNPTHARSELLSVPAKHNLSDTTHAQAQTSPLPSEATNLTYRFIYFRKLVLEFTQQSILLFFAWLLGLLFRVWFRICLLSKSTNRVSTWISCSKYLFIPISQIKIFTVHRRLTGVFLRLYGCLLALLSASPPFVLDEAVRYQ